VTGPDVLCPGAIQIRRIRNSYKASFLALAIEFLIASSLYDTCVANIYYC
jgi:hypothetical protein